MARPVAAALAAAISILFAPAPAHARTLSGLRHYEGFLVRKIEQEKTTLRFFERHPRLLYAPKTHRAAWRVVGRMRRRVGLDRAELRSLRALIRRRLSGPSTIDAIRIVFGPYGDQAIRVARCETAGTMSVHAKNGQYLGLFQMGAYARRLYGHAQTALGQARAAYRYFVASGYGWGPWSCKP